MANQPTAPWWATLVSILLTAVVSVLGTLLAIRGVSPPSAPSAPSGIMTIVKDTIGYLPHIMLVFGVVADAITQDGVYSIASLIGVFSIVANYVLGFFWRALGDIMEGVRELIETSGQSGRNPIPANRPNAVTSINPMRAGGKPGDFSGNYDGCEVQGFSALHSKYAPQTLVVTATIFSYYIFDIVSNRGWSNAAGVMALFIPLYLVQVMMIGDCNPEEMGRMWKALVAAIEGVFFGGTSYGVVQAYFPNRLPSSAISIFPRMTASDLKPGPNGTMVDSSGNPYNCLPNGQCVPDLSSLDSRKKFAEMAAENLGTGSAATPADCPAGPRT
jgi:hypothetical protein